MQNGSSSDGVAMMEAQIQNLLESLLELGICASDVHPSALEATTDSSQEPANGQLEPHQMANPAGVDCPGGLVGRKIQDTVSAMTALFSAHHDHPETRELLVPNELIEYVDQGRNPDIYTRETFERVAGENMYTNGIISGIAGFRDLLAQEMAIAFPSMKPAIDDLRIEPLTIKAEA